VVVSINTQNMNIPTPSITLSDNASLFTKARYLLTFFMGLALTVMLSLILVSESISSSAANINTASSLRIIASTITSKQLAGDSSLNSSEIASFQHPLDALHTQNQLSFDSEPELALLFSSIFSYWERVKLHHTPAHELYLFTAELDRLIIYFQAETEEQIQRLRLIQFFAFFLIIIISSLAIFRIQRTFVTPFKQLLHVATEAGRGNFKPQADEKAAGELGFMAKSLNDMTQQLSLTYKDFENNVAKKTRQLEQSNLSLKLLYRSAHHLSSSSKTEDLIKLLPEIESCLGVGQIFLTLNEHGGVAAHDLPNKHNTHTIHMHPINKNGHAFGTLVWKTPSNLRPRRWQKELIGVMTSLMASSIDLELKRHAASRVGIMEERAVIARELHDSLAQSLSYLKLQISLLNKQFEKGLSHKQITPTINEISEGTNTAYKQLREVLTTFRLKLDQDSIEDSIQQSIHEFSIKCGYSIDLQYQLAEKTLRPHQEIHLLQIIREALSNIQKHSQATQASIQIIDCDGLIQIEISDNGCGLPSILSKEGHFGLNIMKERAKSLNASLKLSNNEPHGTKVLLNFPSNSEN